MKKRTKVIWALCTALNLLVLACAGWLFYQAQEKAAWGPPVQAAIRSHGDVGYLRINPDTLGPNFLYQPAPEYVEYEFLERIPNGNPESQNDLIRIKRTVSENPSKFVSDSGTFYMRVAWYCEEDQCWYAIYYPNYLIPASASSLAPGERVLECSIPSDVLVRPGRYKIEFYDLGCCEFEIP